MTEKRRHVEQTPNFVLHREVVDDVDSDLGTPADDYVNFDGFEDGIVQVVPSASANPTIEVTYLSEEADQFVSANPKDEFSGLGVGWGYQAKFKALGRKVRVSVTSGITTGDTVKLLVAGFNQRKA